MNLFIFLWESYQSIFPQTQQERSGKYSLFAPGFIKLKIWMMWHRTRFPASTGVSPHNDPFMHWSVIKQQATVDLYGIMDYEIKNRDLVA
jgi:hypothetical protein